MADVPRIHVWKNDIELQELSADTFEPQSLEDTERRVMRWIEADPDDIRHCAVRLRADNTLVGFAHLAMIDLRHRRCHLGVFIGERSHWGAGYGAEACRALIAHAFTDIKLNRVGAEAYATNTRAIRMLTSLGFQHEGTVRESLWRQRPVDEHLFGLLAAEWER